MNMDYMITEGSKYRVNHGDEELTEGVFKGFSVIGNDTAMVFELADGTLGFSQLLPRSYSSTSRVRTKWGAPKEIAARQRVLWIPALDSLPMSLIVRSRTDRSVT